MIWRRRSTAIRRNHDKEYLDSLNETQKSRHEILRLVGNYGVPAWSMKKPRERLTEKGSYVMNYLWAEERKSFTLLLRAII
ncbi:hypothetical protein E2C01_097587 [Portunus trituberculatus]|uniref:Uncharacterized protein n=1 Tax=Portunus trituberculatus TaxID=210409 RepID=A0A5B7JVK4_PORTR|nr:hypothetical protein [Portunus trituberculatus]